MNLTSLSPDGLLAEGEQKAYWVERVARLEQIVCELLRRNCELRFELVKSHPEPGTDVAPRKTELLFF